MKIKDEIINKITDEILEDFKNIMGFEIRNHKFSGIYWINSKKIGNLRYFINKAIRRNLRN